MMSQDAGNHYYHADGSEYTMEEPNSSTNRMGPMDANSILAVGIAVLFGAMGLGLGAMMIALAIERIRDRE